MLKLYLDSKSDGIKNDGRKICQRLLNTKALSLAQEVRSPQIAGVEENILRKHQNICLAAMLLSGIGS